MYTIERYNRELKGCKFKISLIFNDEDICFMFGNCIYNGVINISWIDSDGIKHGTAHIDEVFKNIEKGLWILDINDIRKKKLETILDGFERKI